MRVTLGQVILDARKKLGLLQKYVANKLKITAQYLSHIETGRETHPSSELLDRIAELLDLDKNRLTMLSLLSETVVNRLNDSDANAITNSLWTINKIYQKYTNRELMAVTLHLTTDLEEVENKYEAINYYRVFDNWKTFGSDPNTAFGKRTLVDNLEAYHNAIDMIGKEPPWSYQDIAKLPVWMKERLGCESDNIIE